MYKTLHLDVVGEDGQPTGLVVSSRTLVEDFAPQARSPCSRPC